MKLVLVIDMENEAFCRANGTEAARILKRLAGEIKGEKLKENYCIKLFDVNGNKVGICEVD